MEITVWGKQAESVSKYLQKGSPAFIEGRLQLDQWEDKETGKSRSRLKVIAERVQFLGGPKGGGNDDFHDAAGGQGTNFSPQAPPPSAAPQSYQQTAAPNVPPPMPTPPPAAPVASAPAMAPANVVSSSQPNSQPPVAVASAPAAAAPDTSSQAAPPDQNGAFNPSTEAEDDIPF